MPVERSIYDSLFANAAWAAPLAAGILIAVAYRTFRRWRRRKIALKPNCLLTFYPLVLVRRKSWFQLFNHDMAADYLAEHGYEVISLRISGARSSAEREIRNLFERVQRQYGKAHIFCDEFLFDLFKFADSSTAATIASCQVLTASPIDTYLERAISLAENDFQCSH